MSFLEPLLCVLRCLFHLMNNPLGTHVFLTYCNWPPGRIHGHIIEFSTAQEGSDMYVSSVSKLNR